MQTNTVSPAYAADKFVDSIGVCIHGDYDDLYSNTPMWKRKLQELGVRHVRDRILSPSHPRAEISHRTIEELHREIGVTYCLIVDMRFGALEELLSVIKHQPGIFAAVEFIEGPNEYDNRRVEDWVPKLRDWIIQLNRFVKTDSELRTKKIVGPSIVKWVNPNNFEALGDIDDFIDFANLHAYSGGNFSPDVKINMKLKEMLTFNIRSGKPIVITESGYHNAVHQYTGHVPSSETASAKYLPRMFLDTFRQGFVRTYAYELLDQHENPAKDYLEAHFGLVRFDGSNKPAFEALRRLIALLSDPGAEFVPGTLEFSLDGDLRNVRHLLLQKSDGSFYLALWTDVPVYVQGTSPNDPGRDLPPAVRRVTLALRQPELFAEAEVFKPSLTAEPGESFVNPAVLQLDVPDEPLILKLVPVTNGREL